MTEALLNFFHMGGYGLYVFPAYGCVIFYLLIQWLIPWRRWRNYLQTHRLAAPRKY